MLILAIDPGFDRCGVALLERGALPRVVYSECVLTKKGEPFVKRLTFIGQRIESLIETYRPTALCIETLLFSVNKKTAIQVAEVRGMLIYIAGKHAIPFFEYNPGTIKVAVTGYGKATKDQIYSMIPRLITGTLNMKALDDEYDAIAIGITHIATQKHIEC